MKTRHLLVIRGKLGDTLIAWAAAAGYAERHPEAEITVLVRRNYLPLLARERGVRLVAFASRVEMIAKLLWLRVARPCFDALAVLWGFGPPMAWIGRLACARRKIYLNPSLAEFFPEYPAAAADEFQVDPAGRVMRCLHPERARPLGLALLAGAALGDGRGGAIGLVPFAGEPRRNLDSAAVAALAGEIQRRHPKRPVWIFVDPGEERRVGTPLPPGVEFVTFATLEELIDRYSRLESWYGTDTGPYHLAVAMGIPATVFFGPTQPLKNAFPAQPNVARVRLRVLGNEHCEQKQCARPLCLHRAVANFAGANCATALEDTPAGCPLRSHAAEALAHNR